MTDASGELSQLIDVLNFAVKGSVSFWFSQMTSCIDFHWPRSMQPVSSVSPLLLKSAQLWSAAMISLLVYDITTTYARWMSMSLLILFHFWTYWILAVLLREVSNIGQECIKLTSYTFTLVWDYLGELMLPMVGSIMHTIDVFLETKVKPREISLCSYTPWCYYIHHCNVFG